MDPQKVKAVLFDMDGTLLDSERVACSAWQRAAAEFGYSLSTQLYSKVLGCKPEVTREIFAAELGPEFPFSEARQRRLRYSAEEFAQNGVALKAGVLELLAALQATKLPLAVSTSTERSRASDHLKHAGIFEYFTALVCGDEVRRGKPDPEIYLTAAQRLNIPPQQCLVVEDAPVGIIAAQAAGMQAVLIPDLWRPEQPLVGVLEFESCLGLLGWFGGI
jgi:HAD superfamily hydrolase (TIGR01509 family)